MSGFPPLLSVAVTLSDEAVDRSPEWIFAKAIDLIAAQQLRVLHNQVD
jgi:hypothetical protein